MAVKQTFLGGLFLSIGILIFSLLGSCIFMYVHIKTHKCEGEVKRDTISLVKTDTISIDNPIPVKEKVVSYIPVYLHDTTIQKDSVLLPITQREYRDSNYYAIVSGYAPNLDHIETYNKTITNTITVTKTVTKRNGFGIGLQVGYGIGLDDKKLHPYSGIGVSFNF